MQDVKQNSNVFSFSNADLRYITPYPGSGNELEVRRINSSTIFFIEMSKVFLLLLTPTTCLGSQHKSNSCICHTTYYKLSLTRHVSVIHHLESNTITSDVNSRLLFTTSKKCSSSTLGFGNKIVNSSWTKVFGCITLDGER